MKGGFIAFDWKSDNLVAQTGPLADNVINVAMVAVNVRATGRQWNFFWPDSPRGTPN